MDPNPYESPNIGNEPPAPRQYSVWIDTLHLLFWGVILGGPGLFIAVMGSAALYHVLSLIYPPIFLAIVLAVYLYVRTYSKLVEWIQISHRRFGQTWLTIFFWPMEQIDRKLRPGAWEESDYYGPGQRPF